VYRQLKTVGLRLPKANPRKFAFFANEEFSRFFAGKLACLLHIEKIIVSKMV